MLSRFLPSPVSLARLLVVAVIVASGCDKPESPCNVTRLEIPMSLEGTVHGQGNLKLHATQDGSFAAELSLPVEGASETGELVHTDVHLHGGATCSAGTLRAYFEIPPHVQSHPFRAVRLVGMLAPNIMPGRYGAYEADVIDGDGRVEILQGYWRSADAIHPGSGNEDPVGPAAVLMSSDDSLAQSGEQ